MSESAIQAGIIHYLTICEHQGKLWFMRCNSFAGFVQRANGTTGRINNAKRGAPDIICCIGGKFVALEVKTPSGRQSADQQRVQSEIERCGGEYFVVRSIDEVREVVKLRS